MDTLFETIRKLVQAGRYIVGQHAVERLEERRLLEWQIVAGLEHGRLVMERPEARPNPVIEVQQLLADGTVVKAVWAHLKSMDVAKLVTVHYL